jgi:hypothetical protein
LVDNVGRLRLSSLFLLTQPLHGFLNFKPPLSFLFNASFGHAALLSFCEPKENLPIPKRSHGRKTPAAAFFYIIYPSIYKKEREPLAHKPTALAG